jgi:transcription initiation factor TFIID subunit 2
VLLHPPLTDGCHSYFEIIKNPMDISTMNAKLEAGMYKERFAFEADFRLMIRNAKTYNMPGTFAYNETLALESVFDKSMSYLCVEILYSHYFNRLGTHQQHH